MVIPNITHEKVEYSNLFNRVKRMGPYIVEKCGDKRKVGMRDVHIYGKNQWRE